MIAVGQLLRQLACSLGMLSVIASVPTVHADPGPSAPDMVPLDTRQVTRIVGVDGLERLADNDSASGDVEGLDPCVDQFAVGSGWVRARSVVDAGRAELGKVISGTPITVIVDVMQAVVTYPDEAGARRAFDQRIEKVQQCAQLNTEPYHRVVSRPGVDTAVFDANRWSEAWTLTETTIVDVSVRSPRDADRAASEITAAITGADL